MWFWKKKKKKKELQDEESEAVMQIVSVVGAKIQFAASGKLAAFSFEY